jgi:5-methylcytosine-specific restriction endonuclease McrA
MKKWLSKLWKYFFALPPEQELIAVQPPPNCTHCGSTNVEVVGTLPVRHLLCRACGKSSNKTEQAMVPAKQEGNVLRVSPRDDGLGYVEFLKRQATRPTEEKR